MAFLILITQTSGNANDYAFRNIDILTRQDPFTCATPETVPSRHFLRRTREDCQTSDHCLTLVSQGSSTHPRLQSQPPINHCHSSTLLFCGIQQRSGDPSLKAHYGGAACQSDTADKGISVFSLRNLASRWEGVRLPRASGKSPDFPRSSPDFPGSSPATSTEVLSLWNLTEIQRFPGGFPDFPGSSLDFPGSSPDFRDQPLSLGSLTPSLLGVLCGAVLVQTVQNVLVFFPKILEDPHTTNPKKDARYVSTCLRRCLIWNLGASQGVGKSPHMCFICGEGHAVRVLMMSQLCESTVPRLCTFNASVLHLNHHMI